MAVPQAIVGLLSLFVVVLLGWAVIVDDPFGGEPVAVVRTDMAAVNPGGKSESASARPAGQADERPNSPSGEAASPSAPPGRTVTIIDGTSGKRQDIVLPGPAEDKAGRIDPRLTESSRHGPLPK